MTTPVFAGTTVTLSPGDQMSLPAPGGINYDISFKSKSPKFPVKA